MNLRKLLPAIKYLNREWATGKSRERDSGEAPDCPHCGLPEDFEHVFTCQSVSASTHRNRALQNMESTLRRSHPKFAADWMDMFHLSLSLSESSASDSHRNYSHTGLFLGCLQQSLVGGLHFIQGRLSQAVWSHLSTRRYGRNTGASLVPTAIRAGLKYAAVIWRIRNKARHGISPKERTTIKKDRIDGILTDTHTSLHTHYITPTLPPLGYNRSIDTKLMWLRWHLPLLRNAELQQTGSSPRFNTHNASLRALGISNPVSKEIPRRASADAQH